MIIERAYVTHALVAAVAIGLVCSLLSVLVVLKRMAFIGQGISHAGFGGVGTAALLGYTAVGFHVEHDLIVLAFCLFTAILIGALAADRRVETDTAIGILLAATMAWGVLAQNLRVELQSWPAYREWVGGAGYSPPWESIMFGNLLNVGSTGMWTALGMAGLVIVIGAALFKELTFYAFDESVARVFGVRTALMHYLLLVMLSLVVVVSIRLVGLILVSALLIIPGASALLLSRRMKIVMTLAAAVGVIGAVSGLLASLSFGMFSPGACIVLTLSLIFAAAYIFSRISRAAA